MFKLTFLGTSSGAPTKNRNVTALVIQASCEVHQEAGLTIARYRLSHRAPSGELEAEARQHDAGQLDLAQDLSTYALGADGVVRQAA
jgi:ribonuclease BN (tRNA processing enzyme)